MYHANFLLFLFLAPAASLEIACGLYHNCVFEREQTAMTCWGNNEYDQLGYGDNNNRGDGANEMGSNLPFVHIGTDFVVEAMSLGGVHSCAMSDDTAIKCFGDNAYSQLGFDGVTTAGDALPFLEFGVDFNVSKIAAGGWHTCALSTDAALKCFGWNLYGQCGAGTTTTPISGPPSQINAIDLGTDFTTVDVQTFGVHVCAKSQQGTAKCFGYNYYGQLGYGDTVSRGSTQESMGDGLPIVNLGSDFTVAAIATGGYHSCALSTMKHVKCWGCASANYGQCGTPNSTETGDDLPVLEFGADFVPMQLALGGYHTCILSEAAVLICFGWNAYGQLGIGSTTNVGTPSTLTGIDLGSNFVPRQVSAGYYHTCAVSTDASLKCWGANQYGQLGLGHLNNTGDVANEMGNNLPLVDVAWPAATTTAATTTAPTTASPTTASPTTASPTTAAPSSTPTANPSASPTAEPTTEPTTSDPTTGNPTTTQPTTQSPTTVTTTPTSNNNTVTVTIRTDSLSSTQILIAIANVYNSSSTPLTFTTLSSDDDEDGFAAVELLVAVPSNVELDYDVIEATLREAMVDEYGDGIQVDIDVHGDDEDDTQVPTTTAWSWGIPVAVSLGVCVCVCCVAGAIRGSYVRRQRRLSENVAKAQLEEEAQQARNEIVNDAEVRVPSGVVAYARENAHVEDSRGEDNLSLPAQESVLCVDARGRDNIELAIAEARVVPPGVVAHARENAHVEDTRGEDNLSLPAHESVFCEDEEEGIAGQGRRQSQQQHDGDAATLQTAVPTSGATAGIDPSLGVYELNLMVDL